MRRISAVRGAKLLPTNECCKSTSRIKNLCQGGPCANGSEENLRPSCPWVGRSKSLATIYASSMAYERVSIVILLYKEERMLKVLMSMLVVMAIVALTPSTASARLFRRANRSNGTTSNYYRTNYSTTTTTTSTQTTSVTQSDVSTAQGVANLMARYNRVGHFGGNPGYEGCGCGSTPQAAYSICCYGNSGMTTVDVGYAQASNGMWFCCRRYQ
jgi:hypothetical protein